MSYKATARKLIYDFKGARKRKVGMGILMAALLVNPKLKRIGDLA